jgi:hypothetical protein
MQGFITCSHSPTNEPVLKESGHHHTAFLNNTDKYYHLQNDVLFLTTFLYRASFLCFAYLTQRFNYSNKIM